MSQGAGIRSAFGPLRTSRPAGDERPVANDPKRTMSRISAARAVSAILSTTADLFFCWRVVSDAPPVGTSDR